MESTKLPRDVHLLVMIHGMWGTPSNLTEAKKAICERHASSLLDLDSASEPEETVGPRLDVLVAQTNQTGSTYDGIDWGGERVTQEVYDRIAKIEQTEVFKVTSFSIFGYSLGGLLARYVLGILHSRKFFESVKPANFATFVTPHIGLPRYRTLISTVSEKVGSRLLSRTGEQFYGVDSWGKKKRPLLEVMADKEHIFWEALSLFPHIHIYANSVSDPTVPFVTAAIETEDPFLGIDSNELEIELDPAYGALIRSYKHVPSPKFSIYSLLPARPVLPNFLKRGFIFETTLFMFSPVLLPAVLSFAVLRLASDTRASRSRIRLLEADEHIGTKHFNAIDSLEQTVNAIIIPVAGYDLAVKQITSPASPTDNPFSSEIVGEKGQTAARTPPSTSKPILTDAQIRMVHCLNDLKMHKHFAFFHPVRNAHGLIISRDAASARQVGGEWEVFTRQGEGVLRHWADGFVLQCRKG